MNKTNKTLIVLFLVQVVLILGMSLGLAREETGERRVAKVFEGLDPAKVTKIKILGEPKDAGDANQPPQPSIELTKDGTTWGLASAEGYPADQTKVQEFLDKLAKLKTRGEVLHKSTFHRKLEVADDKYQRLVTLTADGKEIKFYLGTSPSFKNVHLRKAGSDDVLQVGELSTYEVGIRAWDWVDRTYVKIPENDIWSVHLVNKNGSIKLDKDAAGNWSVSGLNGQLKKPAVEDLVRKAATVNLEEPVGKTDKPEYGLGAPLATVTLTTGTSSVAGKLPETVKTEVITIGAKQEKENRYYVKSTTSNYVVSAAGWAVEPFVNKQAKEMLDEPKKDDAKSEAGKPGKATKKK